MTTGKRYLFLERLFERGYTWDEVLPCVVAEDGDMVTVDETHPAYPKEAKPGHVPQPSGVGSEVKRLLAMVGIKPTPGCKCNRRAELMDLHSIQWNLANVDLIAEWMHEEAKARNLPFSSMAAKLLIRRAIRNAEKKANSK